MFLSFQEKLLVSKGLKMKLFYIYLCHICVCYALNCQPGLRSENLDGAAHVLRHPDPAMPVGVVLVLDSLCALIRVPLK